MRRNQLSSPAKQNNTQKDGFNDIMSAWFSTDNSTEDL
jgi:hypothetical protein